MTTDDERMESARAALGILTAWLSEPDGGGFMTSHIQELINEGGDEAISSIISGLVSVAGHLLVKTAAATGKTEREILQELGSMYAG